ncbi:NAD(P)-dependent oxidoreductase [Polynucleobacter sp. Fuers-14]|uniref:NAD-dependent epimerase/dehydratase family protein n=1 Tax=Polynucleobacter sp. Fuers-14 TaxID=1758364 RepID=UPI001C0BE7CB|nr:NAD(P)-dependent oxidoreductase [Polynucleobacter sp. Fuers-14]MBU3641073.1 NAD(P)-dependent oxidoreductase [Polynucleobacter sp. Fuers-14]
MRVLITGAAGFLGSAVCGALSSEHEIFTVDKEGDVDYTCDLSCKDSLSALPEVDVVVNCAAVQYVTKNKPLFFRKKWFFKNNVEIVENIIDRYKGSGAHLVHVGTSMMYLQDGSGIYSPESILGAQGIYSKSKVICQGVIADSGMPSSTVIPCIIGGAGREGLFINFVRAIKRSGLVVIPGTGNHRTNMVHVLDVAQLVKLLVETRALGLYNAAATDPLTVNDWAVITAQKLGSSVKIIHMPLTLLQVISSIFGYRILAKEQLIMLSEQHVLDVEKSYALGWRPKYSNRELLEDLIDGLIPHE